MKSNSVQTSILQSEFVMKGHAFIAKAIHGSAGRRRNEVDKRAGRSSPAAGQFGDHNTKFELHLSSRKLIAESRERKVASPGADGAAFEKTKMFVAQIRPVRHLATTFTRVSVIN